MNIFVSGESGTIPMQVQYLASNFGFKVINTQLEKNDLIAKKHHQSFKVRRPELDFLDRNLLFLELADMWRNVDVIIHSGAFVGTDFCSSDPSLAIRTNVEGTQNIVEISNKYEIPLVYLSTTAILDPSKYGPHDPMDEMTEINPQTLYGITKYAGELIVQNTCENERLILRPVFGFGNYPDDLHSALTKVIYVVYKKIIQKTDDTLLVLLNPDINKSYTRVENIATCILKMIHKFWEDRDHVFDCLTYNIGEHYVKSKDWEQLFEIISYNFEIRKICPAKEVRALIEKTVYFAPEKDYLHYHNMNDAKLKGLDLDFDKFQNYLSLDRGISMTIDSVIQNVEMQPYWL
jgi:dTDP-4-dehydrorhamnose reductase